MPAFNYIVLKIQMILSFKLTSWLVLIQHQDFFLPAAIKGMVGLLLLCTFFWLTLTNWYLFFILLSFGMTLCWLFQWEFGRSSFLFLFSFKKIEFSHPSVMQILIMFVCDCFNSFMTRALCFIFNSLLLVIQNKNFFAVESWKYSYRWGKFYS